MKPNELVRPAGIGRKQVAFATSVTPSPLSEATDQLNALELTAQRLDTVTSVTGLGEAAAYSAATAAQNEVQNFPFEMDLIQTYAFTGSAPIQFGRVCVRNPYIDYDARTQQFFCRKPGWYFIKCFIHFTGVNGNYNWYMYLQTDTRVRAAERERYPQYMAYANAYKHCALNGTALYNVPVQIDGGFNASVRPFQIFMGTDYTGQSTLTNTNTKIGLQIIYLGALPMSERLTYTEVEV